jgi:single-strand DNA-binding protein
MGFVNKVMLLGNMTREPEVRQLPSGSAVCDFGLAINRVYKTTAGEEKQETLFVDCTAFGRTGEIIAEYCPKGRSLFVEGRLHFESWEDKLGNRRSKLSVIVENVQLIGSRDGATEGKPAPQRELELSGSRSGKGAERSPAEPSGRERVVVAARKDGGQRQEASRQDGAARRGKMARKPASDDQAIDRMAEESRQLEEADLPF